MPHLVPLDGPFKLVMIALEKPVTHLGSKDDNDVVVKISGVSRRHARIVQEGGAWVLEDLESSTCVIVEGKPVKKIALKDKLQFSLGDSARFVYLEQPDAAYVQQLGGTVKSTEASPTPRGVAAVDKLHDLESLLEIGASINSSLEPQEVLEGILEKAIALSGAERGFIMLLDDGELVPRVSVNMEVGGSDSETSFSSSFAKKVLEKNETIVSTNVAEDPRYRSASIIAHNIFAIMCAPLVAKGKTIGCLYVDRRKSLQTFSGDLVKLFSALTHQAALAIHNARMADDLRRSQFKLQAANVALKKSLAETEALYETSRTLNEGQEVNAVLKKCLARARAFLRADRASLMLLDEKSGFLSTRFVDGAQLQVEPALRLPLGEGIAGAVAQDGAARLSNRGAADPAFKVLVPERDLDVHQLMCAPLKADNQVIGVINMVNRADREPFTDDELNFLSSIASVAAVAIVKARVDRDRLNQVRLNKQVEDARQVQRLMLPTVLPYVPGFDFAAQYVPANKVGGDYYDCLPLDERHVALVVGDVSGHDLASSIVMVMGRNLIKMYSKLDPTPAEVMAKTSAMLVEDVKSQWYIVMFYGVLDIQTRELVYCNAGNQPPIILKADGRVDELPGTGYPLGMIEGATYDEHRVTLEVGDILLAYTDGLVEAQDSSNELYEMERFQESARRHRNRALKELVTGLHADVLAFTGGKSLQDDFTVLAVKPVPARQALSFSFPSKLIEVPQHLQRIAGFAQTELGVKDATDILVAVSAALTNAVCHGNRFDPARKVFVVASPSNTGLAVTICDEGNGFDAPAALAQATGRKGLARIKEACAAVTFNETGNAVMLEFARR